MQHDHFIGQVQNRAQLPTRGDAERITRVVLETLGEQLDDGGARHLAAQLPAEIGRHLIGQVAAGRLTFEQFVQRIALRERMPIAIARKHIEAVIGEVRVAVSTGVMDHVRAQLPADYSEVIGWREKQIAQKGSTEVSAQLRP
jgi:uncharacterized protein (DUF2267 family)